ncbi:hypothetical protein FACS189476_06100 [Spirochaetia bacterium]|nr:hypothetical protein FACS189476_06100 [Spirochaetia bacterium]
MVCILNPDDGPTGTPKLTFSLEKGKVLQSYTFTNSVNDPKGSFSLSFYPNDDYGLYKDQAIMDMIEEMDIVQIFEFIDDKGAYPYPTFTGVIIKKLYSLAKIGDDTQRRVSITGYSIAGLIQEFRISLDAQAMEITDEIANNNQIEIELTQALMSSDNKGIKVSEAINIIWKSFLNLSTKYGKLSNPKVAEIIKTWIGENPFDVDDSSFFYPLGNVFYGQNTQSFYDVIQHLIPRPVYEIFPFTDKGETKIKIRVAPFNSDKWDGLNPKDKFINPVLLKSCDISQSCEEVYTVFYSYLDGYPMQMDKALMLSAKKLKGIPGVMVDEEKFGLFGYRPLFLSFRGYSKSMEDDTTTGEKINELNQTLKAWFGNLEKMYNGNITMSTDISTEPPCAGEKIPFLGGEFYVVSSEHRWNYGGNPETALAISRGGIYGVETTVQQKQEEEKTEIVHEDVNYTVKAGDVLGRIAIAHGGIWADWVKIMNANPILIERYAQGKVIETPTDKTPIIYEGDKLIIPWLGKQEFTVTYKLVEEEMKNDTFHELKDVSKRYQELEEYL